MNFLHHAAPYLDDDTLMAVCTGIPDWLSVIDRKIRIRRRMATVHVDHDDRFVSAVGRGVSRHIEDDGWFHQTEAFVSLNLRLAVELRERLPSDRGFRPMFLGHILIEVILDSRLAVRRPEVLDRYYDAVAACDAAAVQTAVNQISGRPTDRLVDVIPRFVEQRFIADYADDERLLFRMNQVMRRVGLEPLPGTLVEWLPRARSAVADREDGLLTR